MSGDGSDLQAPVLLLAMPQVLDPFFHRSVVLLLNHTEEGSFGFIVNRPTGIQITEVLKGMEIVWGGSDDALAYFGGPVQPQMGTVLFDQAMTGYEPRANGEETATEVVPGIRVSQHLGDLTRLAARPSEHFRLYLGYAGWGSGQLMEEIVRNDWLTAPVQDDFLFAAEPEQVWERALASLGVDPATLPSWTQPGEDEGAN